MAVAEEKEVVIEDKGEEEEVEKEGGEEEGERETNRRRTWIFLRASLT